MKKLNKLITLTVLAGLVLMTGCGSQPTTQSSSNTPQTQQQPQDQLPKILALANNPEGTIINTMGTGIVTVLTKSLGIQVKSSSLNGPQEWLPMLGSGEMDLGVLNNWDANKGWKGEGTYSKISNEKGFSIGIITSGHKSQVGVLVANNSDIKTGADLKGKKYVGIISGTPGIALQSSAVLSNFGLKDSDVKMITVPNITAAVQAIETGLADAACVGLGTPQISNLDASNKGARFLSLDPSPEAVKRATDIYPGSVLPVSPDKANVGIREKTNLLTYEFYLVGRTALNDFTVYNIVKGLWDNNKDLTAINKNLSDWTTDNFVVENFTIPFHPGAIKFYKEKNIWTPSMEKWQKEILASKK